MEEFLVRIGEIGRRSDGSYWRLAWTEEDRAARRLFVEFAERIGMTVETDSATNLWARNTARGSGAVVTGSHLDTVRGGGNLDGALGVATGLAAASALPGPMAVVVWSDEEGARFNTPCFGSRVLAGAADLATVLDRSDEAGITLGEALEGAGIDSAAVAPEPDRLTGVKALIELHIEQGRLLAQQGDERIGIGSGVWPHGRWRVSVTGEGNHAGTTRMSDRRDPTAVLTALLTTAPVVAQRTGGVATVGRIVIDPNSTSSVPRRVDVWFDLRAETQAAVDEMLLELSIGAGAAAADHRVELEMVEESRSSEVRFADLGLGPALAAAGIPARSIPTAAGHDAAILAPFLPAGMLFVRNPSGVSHAAGEATTPEDRRVGLEALMAAVTHLASR